MRPRVFLRLYPAPWRRRYGAELEDILGAREVTLPIAVDLIRGALDAHLHPKLLERAIAVGGLHVDLSTPKQQINRLSTYALLALAVAALLPLLLIAVPAMLSGQTPLPERSDEGIGAHVFQLAIAALVPVGLLFLVTADWSRPVGIARRLALPTLAVFLAFAILYYYEHLPAR